MVRVVKTVQKADVLRLVSMVHSKSNIHPAVSVSLISRVILFSLKEGSSLPR